MPSLQDNVHIIPLGHEYDRAVAPFKKHSVDRVYLLSISKNTGDYSEEMVTRQVYFTDKVQKFFEKKHITSSILEVNLFDLLEVMKRISALIINEQSLGNKVHVNMSACGRKTSIGATLAGMANGAVVYYVSAENYSLDYDSFWEHGLSICESGETFRFENFEFDLPDPTSQKILVELFQKNKGVPSKNLRDFLHDEHVEGFGVDVSSIPSASTDINKRGVSIEQSIRFEKKYLGPLEASGYVKRERSGRNNIISITESGKYVACINGNM